MENKGEQDGNSFAIPLDAASINWLTLEHQYCGQSLGKYEIQAETALKKQEPEGGKSKEATEKSLSEFQATIMRMRTEINSLLTEELETTKRDDTAADNNVVDEDISMLEDN